MSEDGNHFSISDLFSNEGFPYYRGGDAVGNFFIEDASAKRIPDGVFRRSQMVRSHLAKNDVLLSIVATVGETSLVSTDAEATCSCKLAILRPTSVGSEYLAAFLLSKTGRLLTERWSRGTIQSCLLLEDMDQIRIPRFSSEFEAKVATCVKIAHARSKEAKHLFEQAASLFDRTTGMDCFAIDETNTNIKSFSDAFKTSSRLDAEFHQAKYEKLIHHLLGLPNARLADLATIGKSVEPGSDAYSPDATGMPFLRVADYDRHGVRSPQVNLSKSFVRDNKAMLDGLRPKKLRHPLIFRNGTRRWISSYCGARRAAE